MQLLVCAPLHFVQLPGLEGLRVGPALLGSARRQAELTACRGPGSRDQIAARRLDPRNSAGIEEDGVGNAVRLNLNRLAGDFRSRDPTRLRKTGRGRSQH